MKALAIFMALLFIIKDIAAIAFYAYPTPFHENIIFTKHMLISLDVAVLSIISVCKQIYKIFGICKRKTFAIQAWMGSAVLMGIFNIYKLGELGYYLYPQIMEGNEESEAILVGIIVFASLIIAIFISSLFIARKAIHKIEEARLIFRV